jgi:hypothetical protein
MALDAIDGLFPFIEFVPLSPRRIRGIRWLLNSDNNMSNLICIYKT